MLGVCEMGRKQNYYIFAPEKKKTHRAGCLILILSVLFAGVVLTLLILLIVGAIYFAMSFPIARLGAWLERRWREND